MENTLKAPKINQEDFEYFWDNFDKKLVDEVKSLKINMRVSERNKETIDRNGGMTKLMTAFIESLDK